MPPNWVDKPHELEKWKEPWKVDPSSRKAAQFKKKLWEHGYLSPNFTRHEASGAWRNPLGTDVPESLRTKAQYHAFKLERVRHAVGRGISPYGWYRNPRHNAAVGGASQSQHMNAWATDWSNAPKDLSDALDHEFQSGGRGYQGYVGGTVRHVDNGPARQWVY